LVKIAVDNKRIFHGLLTQQVVKCTYLLKPSSDFIGLLYKIDMRSVT
jgi:hypothetical protein